MTGSLEGKTAIIAGAASGVGRAIARRFAQAGARLMLADTDDAGLDETVAEIEAEIGTEPGPGPETGKRPENLARFSHAIEDKLGVTNLIAATIDNFERIDVLVTNTRACAPGGLFDLTAAEFDAALNSNVRSAFLQTQLVARRMIQQRKADPEFTGALVNISSIAARRTVPELLAYSVSCAGLDQLTRSTAACLAPLGIRVNAVALGSVMTGNLRQALREREELRDEMIAVTPMGRIGARPAGLAGTVGEWPLQVPQPARRRTLANPPLAPDDQQPAGDNQQGARKQPLDRRLAEEYPAQGEGEQDAEIVERRQIARLGHPERDDQAQHATAAQPRPRLSPRRRWNTD
jgi:7-alpha-hydroxysteroid dehydrogenase